MIQAKLMSVNLIQSPLFVILNMACLVSCNKLNLKTDGNQSAVKVTNSMALEDTDYMPVVRLGNNCTATLIRPNVLMTTAVCAQLNGDFTDHNGKLRVIVLKAIHPKFNPNEPLNGYNLALLHIHPYSVPLGNGGYGPGAIEVASIRTKNDFEMVGFGCKDQAEPGSRGFKRKGKNVFVKPISGDNGILTAQGNGMTTMNYGAPHGNSIGCLGDEGAPALVDNKIVGIYLGERHINGQKRKEAIFADLALPANQKFIKEAASFNPCYGYWKK